MCGHCIVEGYLMARFADPDNTTPTRCELIHLDMALMHATDIRGALMSLRNTDRESQVTPVVALCLVLELFMTEGYDAELATWVDDRYVGTWQALAAGNQIPGGDTRLAGMLQARQFWRSSQLLEELRASPEIISEAESVLTAYRDWWLLGQGKVPVASPAERLRSRGLMDPIENTSPVDFERLYAGLPLVYLSAMLLARQPGSYPLLEELALTTPPSVPDFTGVDLWLQRRCLGWVINEIGEGFVRLNIGRIAWHGLVEVALRQKWTVMGRTLVRDSVAGGLCDVGIGLPEAYLDELTAWAGGSASA